MSKIAYFERKDNKVAIGVATDEFWSDNMPVVVYKRKDGKIHLGDNRYTDFNWTINHKGYTLKDFEEIFNPNNFVGYSETNISFVEDLNKNISDLIWNFPISTCNNITECSIRERAADEFHNFMGYGRGF